MKYLLPCLLTLLFGLSLLTPRLASAQTGPRVWCHKVSWTTPSNLSHTSRRDFPLGIGMTAWPGQPAAPGTLSQQDAYDDVIVAQEAGIDAFAIDVPLATSTGTWPPAIDSYLGAAASVQSQTGKPFYVCPCLDSPANATPAQLASLIQASLKNRSQMPQWPKWQGVPVIWTFNGTGMTSANWKQTFALLTAQSIKVVVILDADGLFSTAGHANLAPAADLDTYAALPVSLYAFRTDSNQPGQSLCQQYLTAHHPTSLAAQLTIGTIWPGYWSKTNGWFVDPQGTKRIRDNFAAAQGAQWLTVTTWDDYAETTEFQPSIGLGTGRLDLLHTLLATWRGDAPWPTQSRFYIWQPNEVHLDMPFVGEVLALIPAGATPAKVQINLCDKNQQVIQAGPSVTFTTPGVNAVPFSFSQAVMPANRSAYVSLICEAADFPAQSFLSEPTYVWPPGDNPWRTLRGTMWQAGAQQGSGPQIAIANGSGGLPSTTTETWPLPPQPANSEMSLYHNFDMVDPPQVNTSQIVYDMNQTVVAGIYSWDDFLPIANDSRWGFFASLGVTPAGTVCWSEPTWVEPPGGYTPLTTIWHFEEGSGKVCFDPTPYHRNATLVGGVTWVKPGAAGTGTCIQLDGTTGSVTVPYASFPMGSFTFSAWIQPQLDPGATTYQRDEYLINDIGATLVLKIRSDGYLQVQRLPPAGFWRVAIGKTVVPFAQWSHVQVLYDQNNLTIYLNGVLEASTPCIGTRLNSITALGRSPLSQTNFFRGKMDEVEILSQASLK